MLLMALGACTSPATRITQALRYGPTELPPQGFHQRCHMLLATQRLNFEFQAEPALAFVIEYRQGDMALQPLRFDPSLGETGRFLPETDREYCLRWENLGPTPAQLRYQLSTQ